MKITELGNTEKVEFPTIVKISGDYYLLSNPLDINGNLMEIACGSRIAINLKTGKWFDFGDKLESQMKTIKKGTKFEIEI